VDIWIPDSFFGGPPKKSPKIRMDAGIADDSLPLESYGRVICSPMVDGL
jgi:hypothetical protein